VRRFPAHHAPRRADRAQPGRDGEGRGRTGLGPQAEGPALGIHAARTGGRTGRRPARHARPARPPGEIAPCPTSSSSPNTSTAPSTPPPRAPSAPRWRSRPRPSTSRCSPPIRPRAVTNPANAHPIAQVLAPQVAELAKDYSHVFLPSTTFGKDLAPCVAALLGVAQVSDLMAVEGPHVFKRPIYAGNAIITVD